MRRETRRRAGWPLLMLAAVECALGQAPGESAAPRAGDGGRAPAVAGEPPRGPDLDFETVSASGNARGWRLSAGAAVVGDRASTGARSLRLEAGARGARARLEVPPPRVAGNRVRFAFDLAASEAAAVAAWVRIDGPDGLLFVERLEIAAADAWARHALEVPVFERAERVSLAFLVEAGTAWLDGLSINGASSLDRPPPSPAAAHYVDYALDLIDRHSLYRGDVDDWPRFRRAVLAQARGASTASDAHLAVRYAIGRLGDTHGWLRPADRAAALERAPVSNARTGRPPVEPHGEALPGGAAYLSVPGFAGGGHAEQVRFAEALQARMRALDGPGVCGWIVDLRGNSGGSLWPMLLGIGPLLGDGDALVATYPDGRRDRVWHRDGKVGLGDFARLRVRGVPYRPHRVPPRVAVLHGPITASAGEVVALAFRGAGPTRSFGAATAGATTGTRTFVLPDGAELVLAVVTMSDRSGRPEAGRLRPDEAVAPGGEGRALVEQPEVRAAVEWLGCDAAALPPLEFARDR